MEVEFRTRDDGIIDAVIGPDHALFNQALEDAVSSCAPRGAPTPGLSTYWIDRVERSVRSAMETGSQTPFASGNVTYLRLDGERVVAGYDFDPDEEDSDSIQLGDFLDLLARWRSVVMRQAVPAVPPPSHRLAPGHLSHLPPAGSYM